jgi:hypothetical protein
LNVRRLSIGFSEPYVNCIITIKYSRLQRLL